MAKTDELLGKIEILEFVWAALLKESYRTIEDLELIKSRGIFVALDKLPRILGRQDVIGNLTNVIGKEQERVLAEANRLVKQK